MLLTCKCGKEFLTEADTHVVIPMKDEENCGCYFESEFKKTLEAIVFYHQKEYLPKTNEQFETLYLKTYEVAKAALGKVQGK